MTTESSMALRQADSANLVRPYALTTAIAEVTKRWCVEQYREHLRALALTGSLARAEGTFVPEGEYWNLLGDAEFLLIFHARAGLPAAADLSRLCRDIEAELQQQRIRCHLSLSAAHPTYLQRLKPHIFAYELRACGQAIWGDPQILSLIPPFSVADMSLEDAWRLVANRIIELLEILKDLPAGEIPHSPTLAYRTTKLYLDMATSLLVFLGEYAPTYRERAASLTLIARGAPSRSDWPFPLEEFSEDVAACTAWKLWGDVPAPDMRRDLWERAVDYAERLWRWELSRLTSIRQSLPTRKLLEHWMRFQSPAQRLRGWLYVLRRRGWYRSWRDWSRWSQLAWRSSPRYWIYAAAAELFFSRCYLGGHQEPLGEELQRRLPVVRGRERHWKDLASDVVWNYREFLVETRA